MGKSANDDFFNIKDQIQSLNEEEAILFAHKFVDENCSTLDAEYFKKIIAASGDESSEITYRHAVAGSPAAQTVYGTAKLHGHFTEKNVSEGLFWLRRAHNNGNAKASIVLCGAYLDGVSLRRDSSKAVAYIQEAAKGGDVAAQYIYANLLIEGDGIEQDEEEGIRWLRRSSSRGYEKATRLLVENGLPLHDEQC